MVSSFIFIVIVHIVRLCFESDFMTMCVFCLNRGAIFGALYTSTISDIRRTFELLPQFELASLEMMLFLDFNLCLTPFRCFLKVRELSIFTLGYFGLSSLAIQFSSICICSFFCAFRLFRWRATITVLFGLKMRCHLVK